MDKTAILVFLVFFTFAADTCAQDKTSVRTESASSARLASSRVGEGESTDAEPAIPGTSEADFTILKQTNEVSLILSVTDAKGRFVDDLTAADLRLLDNHESPAKWNYFQAHTDLPLHVILAIDVSSSIRERLQFEQRAASTFLKRVLHKESDRAAIVAFGSTVQEKTAAMTSDVHALDGTIHTLQASGETAMYDAIVLCSRKLRESRQNTGVRPVIILITDGDDTASKATLNAAEEAAIRAEAAIFALDANSIYEKHPKGRPILERLTRETGGVVLSAREDADLKASFSTIEKILRSQYALGYPPPDLETNGRFRPIEVTSVKQGLRIHVRRGYYAPSR